jgi:hypothetical protein
VFEDISEEALKALKDADHDQTVELFNQALRVMAACQQRLRIRAVHSTVQAGGDAVISTTFDAEGKSSSTYARVDWRTREITISGSAPSKPSDEDYSI